MKSVFVLLSVLALPVMAAEPTLYGRYEYIKLPEIGETLQAKMDNLTDRSSFNYPLLIGAKALREFGAAVNPARRYTADKPEC